MWFWGEDGGARGRRGRRRSRGRRKRGEVFSVSGREERKSQRMKLTVSIDALVLVISFSLAFGRGGQS